ncbi:NAD(P)-dependent oxidoreductase [Pollutimonas subterranea]|uniref:NAD(P)-dependent oxidoreductase n=1 Tax=Pollutimonas subterranea TaxID=2045210 RepID=UPI0013044F93|nr:NAD(P)-dependent oxidoreductase [Pollutimonas subterranea]
MDAPVVLLTDPIAPSAVARMAQRANVVVAPNNTPSALIAAAIDADIIVVRTPLPPQIFGHAAKLRGVIRHGAGIDMIPVEVATAHRVAVANVPGANAVSVAEYALGQMMNLAHRLNEADRTLRTQGWAATRALCEKKIEVAGRTLGIVGTGRIGKALAHMAHHGLGMKVTGFHPSMSPISNYIEMLPLEDLFTRADFIVLACPLNASTRGMVNAALITKMKVDAVLINVSRGPVLDEVALIQALSTGQIRGAALDVFDVQPLPAESPLLRMDSVILSSHMAGLTQDTLERIGDKVADQALQLLDGKLPQHLCNVEMRADLQARLQEFA